MLKRYNSKAYLKTKEMADLNGNKPLLPYTPLKQDDSCPLPSFHRTQRCLDSCPRVDAISNLSRASDRTSCQGAEQILENACKISIAVAGEFYPGIEDNSAADPADTRSRYVGCRISPEQKKTPSMSNLLGRRNKSQTALLGMEERPFRCLHARRPCGASSQPSRYKRLHLVSQIAASSNLWSVQGCSSFLVFLVFLTFFAFLFNSPQVGVHNPAHPFPLPLQRG